MDPAPFLPTPTVATAVPTYPTGDAVGTSVAAAPSHPPYAEMICSAITALKERDGSSRRAIAKFIDEAYSGLPTTHSALLTHHLKRLKTSGRIVMVKKSYKLPRSDNNGVPNTNRASFAGDVRSGPKRGRGRPPKPKPDPAQIEAIGLSGEKRAPGRPRKSASTAVVVPRKSPGRPRKPSNGGPSGENASVKRPGRPMGFKPKTVRPNSKRRPGGPSLPLIVPYSTADVPKPRGRPKMVPVAAVNGGVKRRGRPFKVGGEVKPKAATGKSPGRPKKNATLISEADANMKKKLLYIQTKVKQIVNVLKPQLSSHSSISAVTAVQELEELAALDISAPLPMEAPVQFPVQFQFPIQQGIQNSKTSW